MGRDYPESSLIRKAAVFLSFEFHLEFVSVPLVFTFRMVKFHSMKLNFSRYQLPCDRILACCHPA
jgi:hypothetical protein